MEYTADAPDSHCIGLLYGTIIMGEPVEGVGVIERLVEREMPSVTYRAHCAPEGIEADFHLGLIASFPISKLDVIAGDDPDTHTHGVAVASLSELPVELHTD